MAHAIDQVIEGADSARGDHRHAHRIGHRAGEADIEAFLGAVPVHGGEQNLAGAQRRHAFPPNHGVPPRGIAPAMGEDLPPAGHGRLGVDGDDDALAAEFFRRFAHEIRAGDGGRVDGHLVGAGQQELADVVHIAHAAADGERHEALFRRAAHHVVQGVAVFMAGGDVEETQLVGAGLVIEPRLGHGIAGIHQVDEIDALDHAPVFHVEAGDDADLQHASSPPVASSVCRARSASALAGSMRPS